MSNPIPLVPACGCATALEVGAEQVQALVQAREGCAQALDTAVADGNDRNVGFLPRVSGMRVGMVARLRSDWVFYRPAEPTAGKPSVASCALWVVRLPSVHPPPVRAGG